jgi:predicted nucleic acid-binding protein
VSLALDTNVLIPWLVASSPRHAEARAFVEAEFRRDGGRIAIAPQVCWEFLHVVTDERRFERPCSMEEASTLLRGVWNARETEHLAPAAEVMPRVLELMREHRLGRKRILDTALAATLEAGGVRRLGTYNVRDYSCFSFIEAISPGTPTTHP